MNSFHFIEARTFVLLLTYKLTQWVDLGFCSAEILPTLYTSAQACPNMCVPSQVVQQGNSQCAQPCFVWFCWMWGPDCFFFSGLWLFGNANGCLLSCPCNICLPFCWLLSWSFGTRDLTQQIKGSQRAGCMNASLSITNALIFPVSSLTSKLCLCVPSKPFNQMCGSPVATSGPPLAYGNLVLFDGKQGQSGLCSKGWFVCLFYFKCLWAVTLLMCFPGTR